MGHSIHDPGFAERLPWNAGRTPVAKRTLKSQQIWAITIPHTHRRAGKALPGGNDLKSEGEDH